MDRLTKWSDLQDCYRQFPLNPNRRWVFRGHRLADWSLESKLERVAHLRFREPYASLRQIEFRLIREFRRHLHRYSGTNIDSTDELRFMGLMQHHGAPTRLLDWTYSFFIALYFAAEEAEPDSESAIWAIDLDWCWDRAYDVVPDVMKRIEANDKDPEATKTLLAGDRQLVVPLNPFGVDERLAVQQGLFLVPLDLTVSYMDNLHGMGADAGRQEHLRKITIAWQEGSLLRETLVELQRMNINRRSLFPGLDGLAKGLENWITLLPYMPLQRNRAHSP